MSTAVKSAKRPQLNPEEQEKLQLALKRANDFERAEDLDLMRQPLEGVLSKFTNVVSGWQCRWFVLDPLQGSLTYYIKEEHKLSNKVRGSLQLAGAIISPSDEDSLAFVVVPEYSGNDTFKLKAASTKQRQQLQAWINRLRVVADDHQVRRLANSQKLADSTPKLPPVEESVRTGTAKQTAMLHQLHKVMNVASAQHSAMDNSLQLLNTPVIQHALLVKAISRALLDSLDQCHNTIGQLVVSAEFAADKSLTANFSESTIKLIQNDVNRAKRQIIEGSTAASELLYAADEDEVNDGIQYAKDVIQEADHTNIDIHPNDPNQMVADSVLLVNDDDARPALDTHKAHTLDVVSRLKLGTDLTKQLLPAYTLQSTSMLEACADWLMDWPGLTVIDTTDTPEMRMLLFTKWYVHSFNAACRGAIARKPINPVLGELFTCSWQPITEQHQSAHSNRLHCLVEQVCHHPPVSCLYASNNNGCHISACLLPKCKFMGMSVSAVCLGGAQVLFGTNSTHAAEQYNVSWPTAWARALVSVPWFELTGKCTITCQPHNTSATVTFHPKPFHGGTAHRISADVRDSNQQIYATLQGEWNGSSQVKMSAQSASSLKTPPLDAVYKQPAVQRLVRPLQQQNVMESRRIWQTVATALHKGDEKTATEARNTIAQQQRQRIDEQQYSNAHFHRREDGNWRANAFPTVFD